ncbi:MAG: amidohydrolase family protein [Desulfomonilaceae bacterium]
MPRKSFSYMSVLPEGLKPTRIEVDEQSGKIESISGETAAVDASCVLFPGFMDIHVHAREFPRPVSGSDDLVEKWKSTCAKEVFSTADDAAINGGVTCFAAMPNDPDPPDNRVTFDRKRLIVGDCKCPVILFALISEDSEPWADLPYKLYLDHSRSKLNFSSWQSVEDSLKRYRGQRVFFHAEDPDILKKNSEQHAHWKRRPPEAEIRAVSKILDLTHKYGLATHLCHISTESAVRLISEYNDSASQKITCEVTPHHLFFSVDESHYLGAGHEILIPHYLLNCNPPIRSEQDRLAMIEALRSGLVQVLASDHAPHTLTEKRQGVSGMPHLDTFGPFTGWLVKECEFSLGRIAEVISEEPYRIMGPNLAKKYGRVQEGYGASFTVLDFTQKTSIGTVRDPNSNRRLFTRCGWSPFEHLSLPAYVKFTIIDGKVFNCSPDLTGSAKA